MKVTTHGQTLLESLIAIAIILIGVTSLAGLLVNVISNSRVALAETRATQLAQEALEGARYVRDSNWLKREDGTIDSTTGRLVDYSKGLRNGSNMTAIYVWDATSSATSDAAITFNFTAATTIDDAAAIVYQNTTSGYFLQTTSTTGLKNTGFRRLVTFQFICFDTVSTTETVSSSACGPSTIEVGIQVTATIQWVSQGAKTQRSFSEKLYNWKYANPQVIP